VAELNQDRGLAIEQFPDLNEEFYDADFGAGEYLAQRLRALLLATGDSGLVRQAEADPFDIGELRITLQENQDRHTRQWSYVAVESTVLLHHAAEALFRLYRAHRGLPACPWLQAARDRPPRFRLLQEVRRFRQTLGEPETTRSLMEVFIGTDRRPHQYGDMITQEMWDDHQMSLVTLFEVATELVMREADLYNSAKHGLAIVPGAATTNLEFPGEADPKFLIQAEGPSVAYLAVGGLKGEEHWEHRISWVSVQANLRLTLLIIRQIENLWMVARARYVRQGPKDGGPLRVHLLEPGEIVEALAGDRRPGLIPIASTSRPLDYYGDHDPGARDGSPRT
jgi:hypothetical protein